MSLKITPCALISYSSFSDVYQTIMYESNLSALKTKDNNVSSEIFTKIGTPNDTRGLMKSIQENINTTTNYLFYPYVISKNTNITSNECKNFVFVLVPYNKPDHVIGFIEGGTFSLNKIILLPAKQNWKMSQSISSLNDVVEEQNINAKIFFSGELDNTVTNFEYSYLSVSDKPTDIPTKKIGFTPFGNFSIGYKATPCVKDYCNFFFLPVKIDDKQRVKIGDIRELNKGKYNYSGTTKIGNVLVSSVVALGIVADAFSGRFTSRNTAMPDARNYEINALPICFGYSEMPVLQSIQKFTGGSYYKYKLNKYTKKIKKLLNK